MMHQVSFNVRSQTERKVKANWSWHLKNDDIFNRSREKYFPPLYCLGLTPSIPIPPPRLLLMTTKLIVDIAPASDRTYAGV